jgi:drug/metabolite transporter (DMT)-like permease
VEKTPSPTSHSPFGILWHGLPHKRQGIILMLAGSSFFGISYAFMKAVSSDLDPFVIAFWNDIFALMTVCLVGLKIGGFKRTIQSKHKVLHLLRATCFTLVFVLMIKAFSVMPIANALSISFTSPIIGSLFCLFLLKEKVRPLQWGLIFLSFVGVLVIINPSAAYNTGVIYPIGAAIMTGLAITISRKIPPTEPLLSFGLYAVFTTLIITGTYTAFHFQLPDKGQMLLLAATGILGGLGAMSVGRALTLAHAAVIAPLEYTQLVWGVILGYFIFGDILDVHTVTGATLIMLSGVFLVFSERKTTVIKD